VGFFGGSWGDDERIVFAGKGGYVLMQASAVGGKCEVLLEPDRQNGDIAIRWPQILPGGRTILITIGSSASYDNARVAVFDRVTRSVRVLVNGATAGRYVPTGHLVYVRGGTGAGATLFAAPFDLKRLALTGPAEPVIEGIFYNAGGGYADYAFSDSGLLLYQPETRPTNLATLEWIDRSGASQHSTCRRGDMRNYG